MNVSERAAEGKAARSEAPRSAHAAWEPPADRADPVEILESQARSRVARPGPDPLRADGRLALHLLPRRGGGDGRGPRHHAGVRAAGADVRRRPPLQLRRLRGARPHPRLRPQRLRREPAGALGVGRQAPRRQLRDRRPGERLQAEGAPRRGPRRGARVPRGDPQVRRDAQPGGLVRAPERRDADAGPALRGPGGVGAGGEGRRQGPEQGPPAGAGPAHPHGRRRAANRQRPAAPGPGRGAAARRREPRRRAGAARDPPTPAAPPAGRSAATCWRATASATWPARWSGSAASAPAPGSPC